MRGLVRKNQEQKGLFGSANGREELRDEKGDDLVTGEGGGRSVWSSIFKAIPFNRILTIKTMYNSVILGSRSSNLLNYIFS